MPGAHSHDSTVYQQNPCAAAVREKTCLRYAHLAWPLAEFLCTHALTRSSTVLLKRSTSFAEPMAKAVRWSTASIFTSRTLLPVTPSEVFPPAISTKRPKGAASKASRSLAGEALEVGLVKTPCCLVNCWHTSGTKPPV